MIRPRARQIAGATRLLATDQRGVASLLGLFFVLFSVVIVLGVLGIGHTLVQREGLQDAADAAIFSSAVLHARGMNLIAIINLIMAALVAVLIVFRLLQAFFNIAAAACVVAGFFTFGAGAAAAGPLRANAQLFGELFSKAKRIVFPVLKVLHRTEEATSMIVPWVGTTASLLEATEHSKAADFAVALPGALQLPVESDQFSVLCGHGGRIAAELAITPMRTFTPDFLADALVDGMQDVAETFSDFLCGKGDGEAPGFTQVLKRTLPAPPELDACDQGDQAACEKVDELAELVRPNGEGECRFSPCGAEHPYVVYSNRARQACENGFHEGADVYHWQQTERHIIYQRVGGDWVETTHEKTRRLMKTQRPPCGDFGGLISEEWNNDPGAFHPGRDPRPLCTTRRFYPPPIGETWTENYVEATRIFGCVLEIEKKFDLASEEDSFGEQGDDEHSPFRVQRVDQDDRKVTLPLGSDPFQIRGLAIGRSANLGPLEPYVRLAGADAESPLAVLQSTVGALGIAQAEYYFDHQGEVSPAEWLWEPRWTARLKRFRLPDLSEESAEEERQASFAGARERAKTEFGGRDDLSLSDSCGNQASSSASGTSSGSCNDLESTLDSIHDLILH